MKALVRTDLLNPVHFAGEAEERMIRSMSDGLAETKVDSCVPLKDSGKHE